MILYRTAVKWTNSVHFIETTIISCTALCTQGLFLCKDSQCFSSGNSTMCDVWFTCTHVIGLNPAAEKNMVFEWIRLKRDRLFIHQVSNVCHGPSGISWLQKKGLFWWKEESLRGKYWTGHATSLVLFLFVCNFFGVRKGELYSFRDYSFNQKNEVFHSVAEHLRISVKIGFAFMELLMKLSSYYYDVYWLMSFKICLHLVALL